MNKSVKLFIASLILLAASIGFFAGSVCNRPCANGPMAMEGMVPPPHEGKTPPPNMKGHHGDFDKKGHKGKFEKGRYHEMMDSLLQVTPEQKAALEKNRTQSDSTFKELRKNKFEAEKNLGEALDSGNEDAINAAKAKILDADKALLEHRIAGVAAMSKILSKEQLEKMRNFHKEHFKKMKDKHPAPPQE